MAHLYVENGKTLLQGIKLELNAKYRHITFSWTATFRKLSGLPRESIDSTQFQSVFQHDFP